MDFYIAKGDRLPSISATLSDESGATNLTGASVKFLMREKGSKTVKVNAAATVVSAVAGTVRYDWGASDTDTPGKYEGEWEVTFADSRKSSFPGDRFLQIRVREEVA